MPKYTLIVEHPDGSKATHEFSFDSLSDTLKHIRYFLAGASFSITSAEELALIDHGYLEDHPWKHGRHIFKTTKRNRGTKCSKRSKQK